MYVLLALPGGLAAKNGEKLLYPIADIHDSLLKCSDAVVRDFESKVDIVDDHSVVVHTHRIVSLLNTAAGNERHLAEAFSSLQSLDDISASVYDAAGRKLRSIKAKEFKTFAGNIGHPGFTDVQLKQYFLEYAAYPFTIELDVTTTALQTFMLPVFEPLGYSHIIGERVALEHASLQVIAPPSVSLKYRAFFMPPAVESRTDDGNIVLNWSSGAHCAQLAAPFRPRDINGSPAVLLSVQKVAIEGYQGDESSWRSLGAFVNLLNEGRDVISDEDKLRVHKLTDALPDRRQKIRAVYKYMQEHTRYVAVELGIGGWQTLDAAFVGKNQYGDCKALSNYTMALLKEAGIVSYPVLISAGTDYRAVMPDFPAAYFNHEILCIPATRDTVWLECTSADAPAGYLGNFTEDRLGLMLTPDGGKLIRTPVVSDKENQLCRFVQASLNDDRSYSMQIRGIYNGSYCDQLMAGVQHKSAAALQQYLDNKFLLSSYNVTSMHYTPAEGESAPRWIEQLSLTAGNMVSGSGKYFFVNINLLPLELPDTEPEDIRNERFTVAQWSAIKDTFQIQLPKNFVPGHLPEAVSITAAFGSYQRAMVLEAGSRLNIYRTLIWKKGEYPAEASATLVGLIKKIQRDEQERLVINTL